MELNKISMLPWMQQLMAHKKQVRGKEALLWQLPTIWIRQIIVLPEDQSPHFQMKLSKIWPNEDLNLDGIKRICGRIKRYGTQRVVFKTHDVTLDSTFFALFCKRELPPDLKQVLAFKASPCTKVCASMTPILPHFRKCGESDEPSTFSLEITHAHSTLAKLTNPSACWM